MDLGKKTDLLDGRNFWPSLIYYEIIYYEEALLAKESHSTLFDLTKAFDSTNHDILLERLNLFYLLYVYHNLRTYHCDGSLPILVKNLSHQLAIGLIVFI